MKIVLPVHHFPPRYSAGAELYTLRLARWLLAHGHDTKVVCVEAIDQGAAGELSAVEDDYQGVRVWRLTYNIIDAPERKRWNYNNPLLDAWFAAYFRRTQPDIAHFQAGYLLGVAPLEAAKAAGVPTVLTLHDYWFLCPRITLLRGDGTLCTAIPANPAGCAWCMRQEQRRYQIADQLSAGIVGKVAHRLLHDDAAIIAERRAQLLPALHIPDAVIAPSQFLASRFAPFVPSERLHVARYGLDLAPFAASRRVTQAALRIGYLGQIAPHKGVHVLVDAFRALRTSRPIELHIYGGLDAQPRYVETIRRQSGGDARIQLHDRFANSQVATILAGLDVTVVPSTWYENSPLAIMEAQAAGVPVVTSALGGMAELVRDGVDGLHFRPGNAADLARKLQRLLDEPELLSSLQSGGVPPRSIDDEMRQVLAIYQHVTTSARAEIVPATSF